MNLSFAGCGFLGIYHVGVACCFRKYAPHLLLEKISGASAGAIAACGLICDLPIGEMTSDVLRVAIEARSRSLGPFNPTFNIHRLLLECFEKFLPDDAHIRVSGKLHISLTRVHDGKNVIVSQYDTREELIQALLASAFIPIFSGIIPPKFKGVRYMDGCYSDNLPTIDENTITVSPFCGESDICPRDDSSQLFHINLANTSIELSKHNIYRMFRILFPPKPEVLSNMCKQGFDDALRFLHRNNLISCTRCLAVQSTFVVSDTIEENLEYDPQCNECIIHRQEALVSNLPETMLSIFQEAIDTANKGLLNWIFKHRGMKLLSVLGLPYTLPVDIVYATFTKIPKSHLTRKSTKISIISIAGKDIEQKHFNFLHANLYPYNNYKRLMATTPAVGNSIWDISKYLLDQLSSILNKVNKKGEQITAKILCQLDITEYSGNDIESCYKDYLSTANKMNLNFTFNLDESDLPLHQSPEKKFRATNIMQQKKPSLTINANSLEDDTFERILQVTAHHETIMAYYYLDENNKLKVTEIFDVTDSDSTLVQTSNEKEINKNLEYDDVDWDESIWTGHALEDGTYGEYLDDNRRNSLAEMSECSSDDILDKDTSNLFSDPESEWTGKIDQDDLGNRPESDQPEGCCRNYIPIMDCS